MVNGHRLVLSRLWPNGSRMLGAQGLGYRLAIPRSYALYIIQHSYTFLRRRQPFRKENCRLATKFPQAPAIDRHIRAIALEATKSARTRAFVLEIHWDGFGGVLGWLWIKAPHICPEPINEVAQAPFASLSDPGSALDQVNSTQIMMVIEARISVSIERIALEGDFYDVQIMAHSAYLCLSNAAPSPDWMLLANGLGRTTHHGSKAQCKDFAPNATHLNALRLLREY
ncbi:hypothetical protein K438DRAFT_1753943 [Mycena galopus ATCC 62051]|nr:hypothetical protein K438DRAFT_1753943 [Mycena galopus ATCC 62051]